MRGGRREGVALHFAARRIKGNRQMTSAGVAAVIAAFAELGTIAAAAKRCKVDWHTADKWITNWQRTGSLASPTRGRSGRPKTATSPHVVKRVRQALLRPGPGEYVPSAAAVKRKLKLPYSERSVRRAAREGGLVCVPKKKRTFLSMKNRMDRWHWAVKWVKHDWSRTLCTDEKLFVLEDEQKCCWMDPDDPRFRNHRQYPKRVMVWGGISTLGSTEVIFVNGTMDAKQYQAIQQKAVVPWAAKVGRPIYFQQDNARPHVAAATMAWLAAHPTLPVPIEWPAYSADVSPIENLWALLALDVNKANPSTVDGLKRAIRAAWKARTSDPATMTSLLGGWGERVNQLRRGHGATLKR